MSDEQMVIRLNDLMQRIIDQGKRIEGLDLFTFDRNGLRMAIASIEDETQELYDEWRNHKRMLGNAVHEIRHELLDIAAICMLAYDRTFDNDIGVTIIEYG